MEQFNISPEKLHSIRILLEDILDSLEENELDYDREMLYDIIQEGSFGLESRLEMDYEDLPRNFLLDCDEICEEVAFSFEDEEEQMDDFINELLSEYCI